MAPQNNSKKIIFGFLDNFLFERDIPKWMLDASFENKTIYKSKQRKRGFTISF